MAAAARVNAVMEVNIFVKRSVCCLWLRGLSLVEVLVVDAFSSRSSTLFIPERRYNDIVTSKPSASWLNMSKNIQT